MNARNEFGTVAVGLRADLSSSGAIRWPFVALGNLARRLSLKRTQIALETTMAKRIKVPKRLAGVKIPRAIRKGPVIDFLNTPAGQVVLAQAVLLIGGAFAVDKARDNGAIANPLDTLKEAGKDLQSQASTSGAKLTRAFAAAAHAFRDVMESEDEEAPRNDERPDGPLASGEEPSSAEPTEEPPEVTRKKSRVRSESPTTPH